jgi:hypothetical protein
VQVWNVRRTRLSHGALPKGPKPMNLALDLPLTSDEVDDMNMPAIYTLGHREHDGVYRAIGVVVGVVEDRPSHKEQSGAILTVVGPSQGSSRDSPGRTTWCPSISVNSLSSAVGYLDSISAA